MSLPPEEIWVLFVEDTCARNSVVQATGDIVCMCSLTAEDSVEVTIPAPILKAREM